MRVLLVAVAAVMTLAPMTAAEAQPRRAQPGENRCGWLQNPTPGNYWFTDRDGEWTIQSQGSEGGPSGWDDSPDFSTRGWVATNGSYGYGCACMRVETNRRTMRITRFYSGRPVPIAQCRRDRALPQMGRG